VIPAQAAPWQLEIDGNSMTNQKDTSSIKLKQQETTQKTKKYNLY